MAIKHPFVSSKTDPSDTSLIKPSDWNAAHSIEDNTILDAMIAIHTTSKISVLTKALLNAAIVYNDQANVYPALNQDFRSGNFRLSNPANTFFYVLLGSAITANRNLTLPLMTADDTLALLALAQTLSNKTLDNTTIETIKAANLTIQDATDTTKQAKFDASAIATATTRTYTLPNSSDTLALLALAQTLTNKTLSSDLNTLNHSTTNTLGDLLKNTGSKYDRFGKGAALSRLRVNSAGTDLEYADIEQAEAASSPVADNTNTALGTGIRVYAFFTLPTTERFYIITGIEWKNGATVAGNVQCGVDLIDANPPTLAAVPLAAHGQELAQAGASGVQRNSRIVSRPIRGGTLVGIWFVSNSTTATFANLTGQASQNQQKAIAYTNNPPNQDATAWTAATVRYYAKLYFRGYV